MLSGDGEVSSMPPTSGCSTAQGSCGTRVVPERQGVARATGAGTVLVVTDNNRSRPALDVGEGQSRLHRAGGQVDKPLANDNGDARLRCSRRPPTRNDDRRRRRHQVTASAYGNTITYTPEDRARAFDGDTATA
jgi:hypothetical protein